MKIVIIMDLQNEKVTNKELEEMRTPKEHRRWKRSIKYLNLMISV